MDSIAKVRLTLNKLTVEALEPVGKSWVSWYDKIIGLGVASSPQASKSLPPIGSKPTKASNWIFIGAPKMAKVRPLQ